MLSTESQSVWATNVAGREIYRSSRSVPTQQTLLRLQKDCSREHELPCWPSKRSWCPKK